MTDSGRPLRRPLWVAQIVAYNCERPDCPHAVACTASSELEQTWEALRRWCIQAFLQRTCVVEPIEDASAETGSSPDGLHAAGDFRETKSAGEPSLFDHVDPSEKDPSSSERVLSPSDWCIPFPVSVPEGVPLPAIFHTTFFTPDALNEMFALCDQDQPIRHMWAIWELSQPEQISPGKE